MYGMLGHGEKECDEHKGDTSPKKRLGGWLQASPWKAQPANLEEGSKDGSCARRLFVAKPQVHSFRLLTKVVQGLT